MASLLVPIAPIALIAVVAAVAGGSKKRTARTRTRSPSVSRKVDRAPVTVEEHAAALESLGQFESKTTGQNGQAEPYSYCEIDAPTPNPKGVFSTYNSEGQCIVFWDESTPAAMVEHIKRALADMGKTIDLDCMGSSKCDPKSPCSPGTTRPDPFDTQGGPMYDPNPTAVQACVRAIAAAYPSININTLPPDLDDPAVPDFAKLVWSLTWDVYLHNVCGYPYIT